MKPFKTNLKAGFLDSLLFPYIEKSHFIFLLDKGVLGKWTLVLTVSKNVENKVFKNDGLVHVNKAEKRVPELTCNLATNVVFKK